MPAGAAIYGFVDDVGVWHFAVERVDGRYRRLDGISLGQAATPARGEISRESRVDRISRHSAVSAYEPLLQRAAEDAGIELALLKAVVAAESGFNPDAVSPKGAVGLMQVMPATGARYGLPDDPHSASAKLRRPETNVRIGTRYLADLLRMFPGQTELALAAYNAGEGAVRQYGGTVPPYVETRKYVALVSSLYHAFGGKRGAARTVRWVSPGTESPDRMRVIIPARTVR